MIKRYRCKRTGKEVAAVSSKHTYAMVCEDGHFHSVLGEIFEKGYEEITDKEELSARVKVTKLPHEFVAGEIILARFNESSPWFKSKFARAEDRVFLGTYRIYSEEYRVLYEYAIPYEGNDHLEGKITNCSSGRWPEGYEFPKPEHVFKPFDRVVVQDSDGGTWRADFFCSFKFCYPDKAHVYRYVCVGGEWSTCLPYNEKTAKLIGTTDDWEG